MTVRTNTGDRRRRIIGENSAAGIHPAHLFHGLTCREVAEKLGVAIDTVKIRTLDGMIRLRDALGAT
ncbi:hypothetical protein [Amycolatopsis sp. cmx-4-61]|uniref:hypothetical protein n=1 Tax=Amycolatopsis sp. cmx-4-61 TaxID=2790937 RepID=UPI00397DF78D